MAEHGKKYTAIAEKLDKTKSYQPKEAVEIIKKSAPAKFDETVELHLRMGLDPRNAAQQLRGVALLPHGLGKKVRVLVFAQGEAERIASGAGADVVGGDDLVKKIEEGFLDFATAIIHVPLGKASFEARMLLDNLTALMEAVVKARPSGAKGQYIKSAYITTTMGPGIKLDLSSAMALSA